MGALLVRRARRASVSRSDAKQPISRGARGGQWSEVQFVPARWLVLVLSIAWALFSPGPVSKLGITSLVWSFAPRSVKIVAVGLAAGATIVFLGAIAAIALLALQLT